MTSATDIRAGGAFVEITGKFDGLDKAFLKADAQLNNFMRKVQKAGLVVAGLGAGLAAGIAATIPAAGDAIETQSKFDAVFKESAKRVQAWAHAYADAIGLGRREVKDYLADLQDTFVPLGFSRDRAAEMSKSLTSLAIDLASFKNQLPADALRDMQSALVGNHETVRKYGIIITEAALKQQLLTMGITKNFNEVTAQEKVLARLAIIYAGTTDAQGDAIRTADSWNNRMKALRGQFDNLKVAIGTEAIAALLPFLNRTVELTRALFQFIKQNPQVVKGAMKMAATMMIVGGAVAFLSSMFLLLQVAGLPALLLFGKFVVAAVLATGAVAALAGATTDFDTGLMDLVGHFTIFGQTVEGIMKRVRLAIVEAFLKATTIADEVFTALLTSVGVAAEALFDKLAKIARLLGLKGIAKKLENVEAGFAQRVIAERSGVSRRTQARADAAESVRQERAEGVRRDKARARELDAKKKEAGVDFSFPDLSLGGSGFTPTVSESAGVGSLTGGALFSESAGTFAGGGIEREQLDTQKNMLDALEQIVKNTEEGAASFA